MRHIASRSPHIFPQLIKPFLYFSLGKGDKGAWRNLGISAFQSWLLKEGLKKLKIKAVNQWGRFELCFSLFWLCFMCEFDRSFYLLCYYLSFLHNPEWAAYSVPLSLCFFFWRTAFVWVARWQWSIFSFACHLMDCFDWQHSVADFFWHPLFFWLYLYCDC